MKKLLIVLLLFCLGCSEKGNDQELRTLLYEQLKQSHSQENWFVPMEVALKGLSPEQVNWKDSTQNHSIGELVSHLTFWNEMYLKTLKGEDVSDFEMENDSTFLVYSEQEWNDVTSKLDSIQIDFEKWIEDTSQEELAEEAFDILTMTSHNAYHSGQIIYIRKQNGWWNRK